ncbi:hypothetical protein EDC04DRAFT_2607927 [Pisolithus marmoratus]|nr:hypothetical protein EDC04DRAFT_2607927 [Pisolithus marmoratus]
MPHSCKECNLEFDNKVLHDTHWKKCVKTVTFVTHTGEQVTVTHHQNGTFFCYCSHPKCPKEKGFVTVDALQKHMKTLKTTWLGPERKAITLLVQGAHKSALQITTNASQGAHSSALQVNTNISQGAMSSLAMQVTTNAPQLAPGIADETMKSPSLMSTEDTAMKSPLVGADEPSGQVNELAMASPSPSAFSPRSPMPMQGSSLMSLVDPPPSAPQPATAQTMMEGVRTEHHFIHILTWTASTWQSMQNFISWSVNYVKKALLPPLDEHTWSTNIQSFYPHSSKNTSAPSCPNCMWQPLYQPSQGQGPRFCPAVFTKEKKLREHHGLQHHDIPVPQHWQSCQAQCMKAEGVGSACKLWEVTGDTRVGSDSREKVLVDNLLKELDQQLKTVQVPTDHCLVSPWLLTTHWHEWARWLRKPTEELCALVSPPCPSLPDEAHLKTLAQSIQLYFEEAVSLIDTTDELVLQQLIPLIPIKNFWMKPEANMVISKLDDMLQEDNPDQSLIVHQIHLMLLAIWTTPWSKDKCYIIPDPTESCLALLSLNHDGSFKHPKEVTKFIAKFEYCMCLTFLKEIRACASADTNVDEAAACDDLQPWFNEKNYSTFAHLHSLQHQASAIAFSTMVLPSIWWTDTEAWSSLSFKGNHIAFSDVCKIFQDVEEDLVSTWENKVLKGLKLRVDYEHIVDDPSNRNECLFPRLSMLGERCSVVHPVEEQSYSNAISKHPSTRHSEPDGVWQTCHTPWPILQDVSSHWPRQADPHALDALTSDILIQDLALACPFAEIAAKICFADEEVSQLYHDHLFVNFDRLFTSNDLSTVMAKLLGSTRFKCAMDDIVEMDMEDDVDALQAGHSCATENRVYGLSTHSLAGAAEDILPLFLQASMGWQEHCQVMPSGSGLPYQQACSYLFKPKASTRPPKEPTATMHNSLMSCATDDAMVDKIATWISYTISPRQTLDLEAIPSHPDAAHEAPPAGGKGKGKQKATPGAVPLSVTPNIRRWHNSSMSYAR